MTLKERIEFALYTNSRILVPSNMIAETEGFTEAYMDQLGLSKTDLKKLERHGLAFGGYLPRTAVGFKTRRQYKRGKYKKRFTYPLGDKHAGFEKRWLLVKDSEGGSNG